MEADHILYQVKYLSKLLNPEDDLFLLELLYHKEKELIREIKKAKRYFTGYEYASQERGVRQKLRNFFDEYNIVPEQSREIKIERILRNHNCDNCKWSKADRSVKVFQEDGRVKFKRVPSFKDNVCKSCYNRKLDLQQAYSDTWTQRQLKSSIIEKTLTQSDEAIKCLTLILKIRSEIKYLRKKNRNETD